MFLFFTLDASKSMGSRRRKSSFSKKSSRPARYKRMNGSMMAA